MSGAKKMKKRDTARARETRPAKVSNGRPTIGFLCEQLANEYSANVWNGARDAAWEQGANLLSFSGGMLHDPRGFNAQANLLYELVDKDNVDGLLLWGAQLAHYTTLEELKQFYERYRHLPIVNIGLELESIPSVLVDNYRGMHDVVTHLIEVHDLQRIAYICGPVRTPEARGRYSGYADALEEHGISIDPTLVVTGDEMAELYRDDVDTGEIGARILLDERKLRPGMDFEAVVGRNDATCWYALQELQARGIRVPANLAMAGFDDLQKSRYQTPPLTTARQPFYDQGRRGVEMLLAQLRGEEVSEQVVLPVEVIVRQSCGCADPAVVAAGSSGGRSGRAASRKELRAALSRARRKVVAEMTREVGGTEGASRWAEQVLDRFVTALTAATEDERQGFLQVLEEVLQQAKAAGGDLAAWQGVLSALRRHLLPTLGGKALVQAESLWQQARVLVGETAQREQAYQALQAGRQARTLREIEAALNTAFDVGGVMDVLAKGLPRVGIRSAYLSLYENPQPYAYPQPAPRWSRLMLAHDETAAKESKRAKLQAAGRRFRSRQLVPQGLLPRERQYSLVVRPLFFRQSQIGFVLFEAGQRELAICETLSTRISSALQAMRLLENQGRAEETLMKERNLLRTLIDSLPDSVYAKDAESRFIVANSEATRRLGAATPDEVVGKTDLDLYPKKLATGYSADEQELFRSGRPLINREELVIDQTTGDRIWNLATKVPLRDSQGNIVGLVGIGRNITARKRAEEMLERRSTQLQTAAEVSNAVGSILDPNEMIQQVVDLVQKRFGLYYAGLFLVDQTGEWTGEPGRWAVLRAGTGEAGQKMLEQGHRLEIGSGSMIGWCIANKKGRVALDVGEEAVHFENPLLPDTRSELALPLISRGNAIGALTIQSAQEAAFSKEDISVLQTMADQLANAITNARLYDLTQHAYAEVERQVEQRTAELQQEIEERKRAQAESARLQQEVIEAQKRAIQELSTPIIPVLEGVIVMPLVGSIDTLRARDVTRNLLVGIRQHKARMVILDITGVPIVDSGVAAYLNKTVQAARLKGARTIVTGVSEAVAETIVDLGIDWSGIETLSDLQTGLRVALARIEPRAAR